tara:strand:- start:2218 stop:3516 length:1299 start_codon:yes stop_codon:yes gene_type:complete
VIPLSATLYNVTTRPRLIVLSFALLLGAACGPTSKGATTPTASTLAESEPSETIAIPAPSPEEETKDTREVIVVEPMRIEVIRDEQGNEQVIARDARGLFDEANDALALGNYEEAIALYDEVLADFAESALAPPSIYNAGLALEALGRVDEAVARYQALANREASGEEGIDGRIRAAALLAEYERWGDALKALDAMLAVPTLSATNRLEAMARRGYVLVEAKDYAAAEKQLDETILYFTSKERGRRLFDDDNYFGTMAHFYLGDIPRRQFDAISIRLPESQMGRDIEAKATLLILADERFDEVVRLGHPYWSSAAGFRKADMQREFWVSLMRAPVPPHLGEVAAKLYVKEVHAQSRSLLEKALSIHGKNVKLSSLYNVPTQWSAASANEVVRLTELVGREKAGELVSADELTGPTNAVHADSESYIPGRIEL